MALHIQDLQALRIRLPLETSLKELSQEQIVVQSGSPGAVVEVTDQLMFLFRPAASLRWDMFDGALGFVAEAQYDIASHPLVIDVDADGDNADTLDYGGLGVYVGLDYSF